MSDASTHQIPRVVVSVGAVARQHLEANWLPKSGTQVPRKASRYKAHIRTKTDTGRRGEYPKALERTVVKELGNLTP